LSAYSYLWRDSSRGHVIGNDQSKLTRCILLI
jgi:hypothetical protein